MALKCVISQLIKVISFVGIYYYKVGPNPQNVFPSSVFPNKVCNTDLYMHDALKPWEKLVEKCIKIQSRKKHFLGWDRSWGGGSKFHNVDIQNPQNRGMDYQISYLFRYI